MLLLRSALSLLYLSNYIVLAHMGCGTQAPPSVDLARDQARLNRKKKQQGRRRAQSSGCTDLSPQTIDTYFHFMAVPIVDNPDLFAIPHPTEVILRQASRGELTTYDEMVALVDKQMERLNEAFAETPFSFVRKDSPSVSTNLDYTNVPLDFTDEMRAEFGRGGLNALNVYLSFNVASDYLDTTLTPILGIADLPSFQYPGDGVIMRYDALLGGGLPGTDDGFVLAHEAGHWLGLLHVFHNMNDNADPCRSDNDNDFVTDTPAMAAATSESFPFSSCSELLDDNPDTCPRREGVDPITNWMDYPGDRGCLAEVGEFTCGQIERMSLQWQLYRDPVDECESDDDMEIEIYVLFDKLYHATENSFYLEDATGNVVFDSAKDHSDWYVVFDQDSLLIDLCVPKDKGPYLFVFEDTFGDGLFGGGYFQVSVDGTLVEKVDGAFGFRKEITITAASLPLSEFTASPTEAPSISPTISPTSAPSSLAPTASPTSILLTASPTGGPSISPTSRAPSTTSPTTSPTALPTASPTRTPTISPTIPPSKATVTASPTTAPSFVPSTSPTVRATTSPVTETPFSLPAVNIVWFTDTPSIRPTAFPSSGPSNVASAAPSVTSEAPTTAPTTSPTNTVDSPFATIEPTVGSTALVPTSTATESQAPSITNAGAAAAVSDNGRGVVSAAAHDKLAQAYFLSVLVLFL